MQPYKNFHAGNTWRRLGEFLENIFKIDLIVTDSVLFSFGNIKRLFLNEVLYIQ